VGRISWGRLDWLEPGCQWCNGVWCERLLRGAILAAEGGWVTRITWTGAAKACEGAGEVCAGWSRSPVRRGQQLLLAQLPPARTAKFSRPCPP
jgi:hypothetical protein